MLTNEAEKINDIIWNTNWLDNSTITTKNAMNMIQMMSRKSVNITAGMVNANFDTCLTTLKTISSYYTFLRTIKDQVN
ncbi:hypothetical protein NQ317_011673 [Molorchus minor]|uniref:Uncharacterized protein n=1 Tax=Molorchus minor TaxID=1323400 RepID=A0ABQ9JI93_9CUCU|nr:hypothetical protein NQ317_011673 [Molorchus minor]